MDPHLQHAPFGALVVAPDGSVTAVNDAAADLLGAPAEELTGADVTGAMPAATTDELPAAFAGDASRTGFEEYYPAIDRWLAVDVVPGDERAVVYLRERSEARERASELDRLRRRLDRTEDIDVLTARTLRTVIDADDRDAVARTVCEGLGTTDLYEFAWVGETDPTGDGLRVVASAGNVHDLDAAVEQHLDHPPAAVAGGAMTGATGGEDTADPALPEWRAVRTGSTTAVEALPADGSVPETVRTVAFGQGLQSAIAVPLSHGDAVYGVLGVYLSREGGLSERERSSLETLGAVAGYAINASRREDLLYADTVTELTLRVDDESLPLPTAARAGEKPLSVAGVVPRSTGSQVDDDPAADGPASRDAAEDPASGPGDVQPGGAVVCYLQTAAEAEPVVDALAAHGAAAAPRIIEGDERTLLQVTLTGRTPVTVLAGRGATVRTGTIDAGGCRLVAAVPTEVDTRSIVEAVDAVAAETTVRSKTDEPRSPRAAESFRSDLEAALTDRQRTVLRTAYLSEYFASPRGSSAEDLADALDITGPTVLYHLRRAQRKLLDAFFTGDDPGDPV